jgi:CheY-like chemotaxis protein
MNQQVIREHLARVGLQTVMASNGRDGVATVQGRMENGETPFDLIFMDIHMPVMDGLEAASKIAGLGAKTPIVAMTANVMSNDRELYRTFGMSGCVSKPFTSQQLWRCLMKYLMPVGRESVHENERATEDAQLQRQLQAHFVKNSRTTFKKIHEALEGEDRILAHRLVHTLKSNAGQIGESRLQNAAADAERLLQDGTIPTADFMNRLQAELNMVLQQLAPLLDETRASAKTLDAEQTLALLEQLEPMLHKRNPECLDLLDDIRAVPGAEELAQEVEDFDFKQAAATLAALRKTWMPQ